jgi:hypothetical protein
MQALQLGGHNPIPNESGPLLEIGPFLEIDTDRFPDVAEAVFENRYQGVQVRLTDRKQNCLGLYFTKGQNSGLYWSRGDTLTRTFGRISWRKRKTDPDNRDITIRIALQAFLYLRDPEFTGLCQIGNYSNASKEHVRFGFGHWDVSLDSPSI